MMGNMFSVLLKLICSVCRQNHLSKMSNEDKNQNMCCLGTPLCFVRHSLYFRDCFWHVLLWQ